MEHNELIDVLNDLIRINHDRTTGYAKAADNARDIDVDLRAIFDRMGDESREYAQELTEEVIRLGGDPARVMGLRDPRAWLGLGLAISIPVLYWRSTSSRLGILLWVVLFLPAANLLMPIGTMLGERLAFLPSIGLCLLTVQLMNRLPRGEIIVLAVALVFAVRTYVRDRDWHDADAFYPKLAETSPGSAKAHYFLGCYFSARNDSIKALEAYDRAVAIFPAYPEAFNNRGCTLVELGRLPEAAASYERCLQFDPGHRGAAGSLHALQNGIPFVPQKPKI